MQIGFPVDYVLTNFGFSTKITIYTNNEQSLILCLSKERE